VAGFSRRIDQASGLNDTPECQCEAWFDRTVSRSGRRQKQFLASGTLGSSLDSRAAWSGIALNPDLDGTAFWSFVQ
jgi:hypothetical protein